MTVDIDALAVDAEDGEPFTFRRGETVFTMPTLLQLDWQDQRVVIFENDTEGKLRVLLGPQYDQFAERPMSTARLAALIELYMDYQGTSSPKLAASSSSSPNTARPSKRTSNATTG